MKKNKCKKIVITILFQIILRLFYNCNVAPTVTITPVYVVTPSEDLGTKYSHIQLVYPGALQTLDVPQPYLTDVDPDAANFVVVFSDIMENDGNEMSFVFALYEENVQIPLAITPAAKSKFFIINPAVNIFKENTEYSLYIYKSGYADNDPTRPLNFENLVEPPAISLNPINPDYVAYKFRTGAGRVKDLVKPQLISSVPSNGEINVDPTVPGFQFQLIFNDNRVPMIDPMTVNEFTILLCDVTLYTICDSSNPLKPFSKTTVNFDFTDNDFKTVNIIPVDTLINTHQYKLGVSAGNSIKDFQGNAAVETDIYFTIKP